MKQISILVLTLLSIVKINSQTIPCYPACDCQGTYYDWDFDGECTSADQQLHSTMFSGNWIPAWPDTKINPLIYGILLFTLRLMMLHKSINS